jgi:hypothetical protein
MGKMRTKEKDPRQSKADQDGKQARGVSKNVTASSEICNVRSLVEEV